MTSTWCTQSTKHIDALKAPKIKKCTKSTSGIDALKTPNIRKCTENTNGIDALKTSIKPQMTQQRNTIKYNDKKIAGWMQFCTSQIITNYHMFQETRPKCKCDHNEHLTIVGAKQQIRTAFWSHKNLDTNTHTHTHTSIKHAILIWVHWQQNVSIWLGLPCAFLWRSIRFQKLSKIPHTLANC